MKPIALLFVFTALIVSNVGCSEKKPAGPPPEPVAEKQRAAEKEPAK